MTIQITNPEVEALINQRLRSGGFKDAEDVVGQARHGVSKVLDARQKAEELRPEFEVLSKIWQRDTKHLSLISKKVTHNSYLRIIGMGEGAIPLILESLRARPDHWFVALRATTNIDPSKPDDNPSMAREAWISWGIEQGYID